MILREPTNSYDSNALLVRNATGTQVGHVPASVSKHLSPLIDQQKIKVEGTFSGPKTVCDLTNF